MVSDPKECAPFHLLLRALTETRDDAAFLALYRCIEQLFPIPSMAELSQELQLTKTAFHVAAVIEKKLGWRRREDDAMAHLFSELDAGLVSRIQNVLGLVAPGDGLARVVSRRVYDLRNQCVHYRPVHADSSALQFDAWLNLAGLILEAVQSLYSKYVAAFDVIQPDVAA
jgi:hypothetical protein